MNGTQLKTKYEKFKSGKIVEAGVVYVSRYWREKSNMVFLVVCKTCKERWILSIPQYQKTYKRKITL